MLIRRPCSTWLPLTALVMRLKMIVNKSHNATDAAFDGNVLKFSYHAILNNTFHHLATLYLFLFANSLLEHV